MKIFWPNRSDPKGFLIENLARKYRAKISRLSSNENSNQLSDEMGLKSSKDDFKPLAIAQISIKKGHWANRDFAEYKNAA